MHERAGITRLPHKRARVLGLVAVAALAMGSGLAVAGTARTSHIHDQQTEVARADLSAAQMQFAISQQDLGLVRYLSDGTITSPTVDPVRTYEVLQAAATGLRGEAAHLGAYAAARKRYDAGTKVLVEGLLSAGSGTRPDVAPAVLAAMRSASSDMALAVGSLRSEVYQPRKARLQARFGTAAAQARITLIGFALVAGLFLATLTGFDVRALRRQDRSQQEREAEIETFAARARLETRLGRALEMAAVESDAWTVVQRAIEAEAATVGFEVLTADSSRAHFHQVGVANADVLGAGCPVGSPASCPAAQRGQTAIFASADGLDACPFLRGRDLGERGAACVPMAVAGNTIAVAHLVSPADGPPELAHVQTVELIARKTADRVGLLRSMADTQLQAATDPLTGLLNRRSLLEGLPGAVGDQPFCVLFADIDRFKALNDTHGHDIGDRALRLLGAVSRKAVRPTDLLCRYGGEEFVIVLPGASAEEGVSMGGRLREELALALHAGTVPSFTLSIGVADGVGRDAFEDALRAADAALLEAKAAGRNRVLRADPRPLGAQETVVVPTTS